MFGELIRCVTICAALLLYFGMLDGMCFAIQSSHCCISSNRGMDFGTTITSSSAIAERPRCRVG